MATKMTRILRTRMAKKMKVEQFKEKYEALQKEGNEIYSQMKPLLKRLKALSKKCMKLGDKADSDKELYDYFNRVVETPNGNKLVTGEGSCTKGWDTAILFRLWDFDFLIEDPNGSPIDAIDNVLYNLKHTRFKKP